MEALTDNGLLQAQASGSPTALDTLLTLAAKQLAASSGGTSRQGTVNFVRPSNTIDYTALDVLGPTGAGGGVLAFAMGGAAAERLLILSALLIISVAAVPAGMTTFRLHLFNAAPDNVADNAAFPLSSAGDLSKYLGYIEFAAPTVQGGVLISQPSSINLRLGALAATTLYGELVTTAGWTPASATAFSITLKAQV